MCKPLVHGYGYLETLPVVGDNIPVPELPLDAVVQQMFSLCKRDFSFQKNPCALQQTFLSCALSIPSRPSLFSSFLPLHVSLPLPSAWGRTGEISRLHFSSCRNAALHHIIWLVRHPLISYLFIFINKREKGNAPTGVEEMLPSQDFRHPC